MSQRSVETWKVKGERANYLHTAAAINKCYYFDKFLGVTVEGVQRVGKTSYTCKSLAQAAGEWEWDKEAPAGSKRLVCVKSNFDAVKNWLVFLPREFLSLVFNYGEEKERAAIWDDAGFWLFSLDWYEPFVKAVSRYSQLCGTQFAALIMTTPDKKLISQKVLDALPKMKVCEVVEAGQESYYNRPRVARVYEKWTWADGKRGGVKKKWEDHFNAFLPDDFYDWYFPKRKGYLEEGKKILRREVTRLDHKTGQQTGLEGLDKGDADDLMENVHKVVGGEERLKEVNEVLKMIEQDQELTT